MRNIFPRSYQTSDEVGDKECQILQTILCQLITFSSLHRLRFKPDTDPPLHSPLGITKKFIIVLLSSLGATVERLAYEIELSLNHKDRNQPAIMF